MRTRTAVLSGVLSVCLAAAACGAADTSSPQGAGAAGPQPGFPLTITNCGQELRFDAPPQRAVTMDQIITEAMLGLGLEASMVGTANQFNPILPMYADAYAGVPVLSDAGYPAKEVLLSAAPDLVVGYLEFTTYSGFPPGSNFTRAELTQRGVNTFTLRCDGEAQTQPLLYERYRELGQIFGVSQRSDEFVRSIEEGLAAAETFQGDGEPLKTFIYGGGQGPLVTSGAESDGIVYSGGTNLFRDLPEFVGGLPPTVGVEEVVSRNPDAIVIVDQGAADPDAPSVEASEQYLRQALGVTNAVRDDRFCVAGFYDYRGGPRMVEAVERTARCLYQGTGR